MTWQKRIMPYNPKSRALARALRKGGSLPEILLWDAIKGKKLGVEFHRQVPIAQYIVDFYCPELLLAIEIDGRSHDNEESCRKDEERQKHLEYLGVRFLRFQNEDVLKRRSGVVETIRFWVEDNCRKACAGQKLKTNREDADAFD